MNELPFTGERFVPGVKGEIWVEHWHRYHFAQRWVEGRRVVDVACGEGYGSALLARRAASVTGIDVSEEAIGHARATYGAATNVRFECAPCTRLPLADGSVDVAVSFETIEHIAEQREFLDELARVLAPEGLLILSCPNRTEYRDRRGYENPFHVKELYRAELAQLLAARFPQCTWYGQRPTFFSLIAPENAPAPAGEVVEVDEEHPDESSPHLAAPLYFLAVASRSREALAAATPVVSVLSDRSDWVHNDYAKVMRELEAAGARKDAAEGLLAERDRSILALQEEVRALQHAREEMREVLDERGAALTTREADLAARDHAIAEKDREILRRRGWRWWLRLPFVRMGLID